MALFNTCNDSFFKSLGEQSKFLVSVKFGSVLETAGPSINGSNWVCGGAASFLPNAEMPGYSSVGSFGFHDIVFVDANGSHQTKRSESLSNDITLNVTIIVLASPD